MASRKDNPRQRRKGPRGEGRPDDQRPDGKGTGKGKGRKVRVDLRKNRLKPRRINDWTARAHEADDHEVEAAGVENISAKGELSRKRTIIMDDDSAGDGELVPGVVVAMRGLIAEVDDGKQIWPCTVRRMLRTRLIEERHPVTVGDCVRFRIEADGEGVEREGVIEFVENRKGVLRRIARKRVHTIVANVDRAVIVSSAGEPAPKPHLIDRYIVAAHDGDIAPIICMNKIDLDGGGKAAGLLDRYDKLGYRTLITCAVSGRGTDEMREWLAEGTTAVVGQSGVGKSSLLNALQPGLNLRVGNIVEHTQKGRHTTTTATLIKLDGGGYVVDTPGVKSLDIAVVKLNEVEAYFAEFESLVPNCKFADCTHRHEIGCAVLSAVESGEVHPERYESYVRIFEELQGQVGWGDG